MFNIERRGRGRNSAHRKLQPAGQIRAAPMACQRSGIWPAAPGPRLDSAFAGTWPASRNTCSPYVRVPLLRLDAACQYVWRGAVALRSWSHRLCLFGAYPVSGLSSPLLAGCRSGAGIWSPSLVARNSLGRASDAGNDLKFGQGSCRLGIQIMVTSQSPRY